MKPTRYPCKCANWLLEPCPETFSSPWDMYVHSFTAHDHKNMYIEPEASKGLVREVRLYGWWDVSQPILS